MIPKQALDNLTCGLCYNSLSVFPIYSYGNKDMVICGRCPLQNDFLPQREHLYEQLAQYIEFPCRYHGNGCIEKLKPSDVQNHEYSCLHKACLCPILPLGECQWQGYYPDMHQHCLDSHPVFTFGDFRIEIDIVTAHEENYVFSQADQTFIAQLKCDVSNSKFYCNVICGDNEAKTKKFSYRLHFTGNNKDFSCDTKDVNVCELCQFDITNSTTSIDISDIIANLNNPTCVICKIDIIVDSTITTNKITSLEESEILKAVECSVCFDYMKPPIMQCNIGHSFCGSHKAEITTCPTCASAIGDTRNYSLEQIMNVIEYPCKHNSFGCSYSSNANNVRDHENVCLYGPYECIIESCLWKNMFSELKNHLIREHKDNIIELNSIIQILNEDDMHESDEYILFSHDTIFKLIFKREYDTFMWSLQIVGDNDKYSRYMFEVDFTSQKKEKFFVRKLCAPLCKWDDIEEESFLELTKCNLYGFIDDGILTYKVRVVEAQL